MIIFTVLLAVGAIAGQVYADEPEAIVGGNNAVLGQFPHQISLQWGGYHICGGSIISPTHILTAAHCIPDVENYETVDVMIGTVKSARQEDKAHKIKCIRKHEKFGNEKNGWENDIAVITLKTPIIFNANQKSIPLASKNYATDNYRGIISGWGETKVKSGAAPHLQWIEGNILSEEACLAAHPKNTRGKALTNPKHICVLEKRGQGACSGDSGGPLVVNGELAGVVSWVIPCGVGRPDVLTKVSSYLDWIKNAQTKC